jgi:hypothetical protein
MFEHAKILDKIERLVEKLPYKTVRIEIEIGEQTLQLTKDKKQKIGFVNQ